MSPSVLKMRKDLYFKYPGRKWKLRVNNMPDDQVIAVWYSMKKKGQKDIPPVQKEMDLSPQMALFADE